jgi:hypothetical protein
MFRFYKPLPWQQQILVDGDDVFEAQRKLSKPNKPRLRLLALAERR